MAAAQPAGSPCACSSTRSPALPAAWRSASGSGSICMNRQPAANGGDARAPACDRAACRAARPDPPRPPPPRTRPVPGRAAPAGCPWQPPQRPLRAAGASQRRRAGGGTADRRSPADARHRESPGRRQPDLPVPATPRPHPARPPALRPARPTPARPPARPRAPVRDVRMPRIATPARSRRPSVPGRCRSRMPCRPWQRARPDPSPGTHRHPAGWPARRPKATPTETPRTALRTGPTTCWRTPDRP